MKKLSRRRSHKSRNYNLANAVLKSVSGGTGNKVPILTDVAMPRLESRGSAVDAVSTAIKTTTR